MRIVLLGDIHAYRMLVPPWSLLGKRLLGQVNLWLNRRHRFDLRLLEPVVRRALDLAPDLVLLSGDLTTTALPGEFEAARSGLARLLENRAAVLVAGNHDRYTFHSARARTLERFFGDRVPSRFPHVMPLTGRWKLLALDAARPCLLSSRGRLGPAQFGRVQRLVDDVTEGEGLVVLCHYPFSAPAGVKMPWDHRLAEAQALGRVLTACRGRVCYLHGHVHRSWIWRPADHHRLLDINAGSPTLLDTPDRLGHGFWQIDLPEDGAAPPAAVRHEPMPGGGWREQPPTVASP